MSLLLKSWLALRPYYGHQGDSYYGNDWVKLSGLNYIRAILMLHSALKSKRLENWNVRQRFSCDEVLVIMNWNGKYIDTIDIIHRKFNRLLKEQIK